jgi:hypothetical protein
MAPSQLVNVSMTPVAALPGLPVNGALLGAVQLSPDGLQLNKAATLSIDRPGMETPSEVIGFTYPGEGLDRVSFLPAGAPGTIVLNLTHFSGSGAAAGSAAGQTDSDQAFADQIRVIIQVYGLGDVSLYEKVFAEWLDAIVAGANNAYTIEQLMSGVARRLSNWGAARILVGLESNLCVANPGRASDLKASLDVKVPAFLKDLSDVCNAAPSYCGKVPYIRKLLEWKAMIQSWGNSEPCLALDEPSTCGFCGPEGDKIPLTSMVKCGPAGSSGPCPGLTVPIGGTGSLYPNFAGQCGQDVGASDTNPNGYYPEWKTMRPKVALVDPLGEVTGVDVGTALITLQPMGMPCLPPSVTQVEVGEVDAGYLVTVTGMEIRSSHVDCDAVSGPLSGYVDRMTVDKGGEVTLTSSYGNGAYEWTGTKGRLAGGILNITTYALNDYGFPNNDNYTITREWSLEGGSKGFRGFYTWGWRGVWLGLWTGCHGISWVELVPWPQK